eukprot:889992-Prorocentrum_minimum.AAC.5
MKSSLLTWFIADDTLPLLNQLQGSLHLPPTTTTTTTHYHYHYHFPLHARQPCSSSQLTAAQALHHNTREKNEDYPRLGGGWGLRPDGHLLAAA